ncbi:MAG: hypothetical protein IKN11_09835 [Bacteroidales bacterium]|nr:hypothetical protein [Bacteroidales bacterium]MBR6992014.1 hypothetical protein [Bacteroidales bacterium]
MLLLLRTGVGESVKRQSARLFEYEYIPNQQVDIDRREAAGMADSIYKDFRKKYRFHYQTVGMASFGDSSRLILLSDIPPHFETDSIAPIFADFTHRVELRKHPIGYDGYVTDVLILLGNATQENCDRLVKRLDCELFFSDYKPTVMKLPAEEKRCYFAKENIDYQITLEEFNTWFMEEGEGFIHLDDTGTVLTISDIFAKKARGVYFSQQPGFVAWAVAKNEDIAAQMGDIRQFTLDADLILGALADSSTLVVIGRERQSPLHELPPLQVESILLLASTTEKELSQSLDVNDLMAGKMVNGKDWCPTYLSRELENTEFGDLMTITDVLLKDWSEHGTIQEGYYRYPEPGYYPFDKPLFKKLGLNELVYNWNTAGAMYAIDREGYTIYTLGRTGSLPVSYFNSQERSQSIGYRYESQAYHYFATLGNTDLARVVQYTALYQLFIDNNISYSGNTYPSFPKNKPFLLYKPTVELLDTLRGLSGDKIALLADSLSQRSFRSYQKEHVDKQLRENEQKHNMSYSQENIDAIYRNVHSNTQAGIGRSLQEVKNMLCGLSQEQYKQLARFLSYPRGVKIRDRESYNTLLRGRRVNMLMREVGKNNLDLMGMDLKEVKNFFAANLKGNAGRYMKTSSLIITYADLLTTGGHNLSSRINRVNSMTNYKRSRGNYTPTDYSSPTQPVVTEEKPATTAPSTTGKPSGKLGSKPAVKKATKSKPANTPSSGKPAGNRTSNIRPRGAVISSAHRRTRGL